LIFDKLWLLDNLYCSTEKMSITSDLIVNSITTISSVFVGAFLAFALENYRRKKETKGRHIAAANRALYTVFNLWNILFQFQKEIIDPCREKTDTWINMPASPPQSPSYGLTSFQADELAFLLQTKYSNTFSNLLLEEERFLLAIQLIEKRSSIILNHVHPTLGGAGVHVGGKLTQPEIEKIIGIDKVHMLKQLFSGIIKNVDEDIESLKLAHDEFRNTMKELYPKDKFILIHFGETNNEDS
jgi:hypothetical protein